LTTVNGGLVKEAVATTGGAFFGSFCKRTTTAAAHFGIRGLIDAAKAGH
jgi:hypothetical protein